MNHKQLPNSLNPPHPGQEASLSLGQHTEAEEVFAM